MSYNVPGLGAPQQLQYISSDALPPALGDGVTYGMMADPPGLSLLDNTASNGAVLMNHQGVGLVEQLGGGQGAMLGAGGLGQMFVLTAPVA